MTTLLGLRPNAVKVMEAIHAYIAEHGANPTQAELAKAMGVPKSTIGQPLSVLDCRGWIRRPGPGSDARLQLTDRPWPGGDA